MAEKKSEPPTTNEEGPEDGNVDVSNETQDSTKKKKIGCFSCFFKTSKPKCKCKCTPTSTECFFVLSKEKRRIKRESK